jgi:hypothetical protein
MSKRVGRPSRVVYVIGAGFSEDPDTRKSSSLVERTKPESSERCRLIRLKAVECRRRRHIFSSAGRKSNSCLNNSKRLRSPFTPGALESIAKVHGSLVKVLSEITADQQALRSFASKYMHFHNSAFPIFDDWANRALRSIFRRTRSLTTFQTPEGADQQPAHALS